MTNPKVLHGGCGEPDDQVHSFVRAYLLLYALIIFL